MAFKQPRVPQMKEGGQLPGFIRELVLFLKDFCMECWTESRRQEKTKLDVTATAANSAKLGGKAPEYYIAPRNLLDNSDFTNPVNQRGKLWYAANGYTIDRWFLWSDAGDATISLTEGYAALNPMTSNFGSFTQRFEKGFLTEGKTYTLAYENVYGDIIIKTNAVNFYDDYDDAGFTFYEWIGVKWVALYEGEYTSDTLPPYTPKGYAAELAECQRYYCQLQSLTGEEAFAAKRVFINLPVTMRLVPTIDYTVRGGNAPDYVEVQSTNTISVQCTTTYSHLHIRLSADL